MGQHHRGLGRRKKVGGWGVLVMKYIGIHIIIFNISFSVIIYKKSDNVIKKPWNIAKVCAKQQYINVDRIAKIPKR